MGRFCWIRGLYSRAKVESAIKFLNRSRVDTSLVEKVKRWRCLMNKRQKAVCFAVKYASFWNEIYGWMEFGDKNFNFLTQTLPPLQFCFDYNTTQQNKYLRWLSSLYSEYICLYFNIHIKLLACSLA